MPGLARLALSTAKALRLQLVYLFGGEASMLGVKLYLLLAAACTGVVSPIALWMWLTKVD